MYGYKIKTSGVPKTVFACSVTVDNYGWSNRNDGKTVEIAVSKSSENTVIANGKEYVFGDVAHLSCVAGDDSRTSYCESGIVNEITTVAVSFDGIEITACDLSEKDASDSAYLLPALSDDAYLCGEILRLLNGYIHFNVSELAYNRAKCISLWFEIIYIIDSCTRQALSHQKWKTENYYVNKINSIIEKDYAKKLSVAEIAEEFGINAGYLSHIYSVGAGETFKHALFTKRMTEAKKLILKETYHVDEIARMVGLCDENYLRKSFKRFFGVNITEFKKISRGLALYHDKPLKS